MKKLLILFLLLAACGPARHSPEEEENSGLDASCIAQGMTVVVFSDVQTGVFQTSCTQCHSQSSGNAGGLNLENFANINLSLPRITTAINSGSMPRQPVAPLSNQQLSLFASWKNIGSPETFDDIDFCEE